MRHSPMIIKQISSIARRNVLRNWRQSLVTLVAIASGFMAMGLLDGFIANLSEFILTTARHRSMMGDVTIQHQGTKTAGLQDQWNHSLTVPEQAFIEDFLRHDPDVRQYQRTLNVFGIATIGDQSAVFMGAAHDLEGSIAMRGPEHYWITMAGSPLEPKMKEPAALVAVGLAKLLGCEIPNESLDFVRPDGGFTSEVRPFHCPQATVNLSVTTEASQANVMSLPIRGISDAQVREFNRRLVTLDVPTAQQLLDTDKITSVHVLLADSADPRAFMQRMETAARGKGQNLEILHWREISALEQTGQAMDLQDTVRNIFMLVIMVIVIMSVANTMMKTVSERTREIGTLRSIGFYRRHLILMFSFEGLYLSLLACALGLVGTIVTGYLIGKLGIRFSAGMLSTPIMIVINWVPTSWAFSGLLLTVLATITATLAARRVANMVVADAMRHV